MIISYEKLCEDLNLAVADTVSIVNKFTTKPQGVLIQDSYNNPFFPIRPRPRLDTSKFELPELILRFRELYNPYRDALLPWHYVVEFINNKYYVFNTRPIDMKFPGKLKDNSEYDYSKVFSETEAIHVCILGDSNTDVYTRKIYTVISRYCVQPILRSFKLPEGLYQRVFPINLGEHFAVNYLKFRR